MRAFSTHTHTETSQKEMSKTEITQGVSFQFSLGMRQQLRLDRATYVGPVDTTDLKIRSVVDTRRWSKWD